MRHLCAFGLAIAIAIAATPAHAEQRLNSPDDVSHTYRPSPPPISTQRRAGAIALSVFPGFFLHGIGSWTVHEPRAAKRLVYGELIGIGVASAAGVLVFASGGNQYTIAPGVPFIIAGTGMFFQSWFTDIWVAAGGGEIPNRPLALPPWSVEVGTTWLHDAYRERALIRGGGQLWLGRVGLDATALVDAGGDDWIGEGGATVRILGAPPTGTIIDDNSRLFVRAGTWARRDDDDRTTQWFQEVEATGRLDLERIDKAFRSSFAELGVGFGLVRVKYSDEPARDWSSVLLAHFAWGAYLGSRGEAKLFYEHTRDSIAGGIPAWRASGFVGSVGAAAHVRVYGPWEVRGELEIGNAWLTTLAIGYRGGWQ